MYADLKIYKHGIPLHCHCPYSVMSLYDTAQCLTMQEELNVVFLLLDHILLFLPEVLVLFTLEKYRDILCLVI